jgi:hypothetical protein
MDIWSAKSFHPFSLFRPICWRDRFFLPHTALKGVAWELLVLCGKRPMEMANLWRTVFARRLYVPRHSPHHTTWPGAIRAMRERAINRLGLDDLISRNRVILQRSQNRRIANIQELFDSFVQVNPHDHWIIQTGTHPSMTAQITFLPTRA